MRATGGVAFLEFPFLFGGTFIEDIDGGDIEFLRTAFPFFSEGLSLRSHGVLGVQPDAGHFPSFSEGLSLRSFTGVLAPHHAQHFPSFSEGLSLRTS